MIRSASHPAISRRTALQLAAAAFATGSATLPAAPEDSRLVRFGSPARYEIEHLVTLTNSDVELSSIELWLPVPQDQPEQAISGVKVRPEVPIVVDVTGQAAVVKLVLTESLPAPGESVELKVTYQAACRPRLTNPVALSTYPFRDYVRDKQYEMFLRPEKFVQVGHARILELAAGFAGTRRPAPQVARLAFDYVLEHTEYKLIDGFGGAQYCLEQGHGECGDYSALFVALCRAAGVPARPVNGCWADQVDGWHCWAEFMLPSGEWVPVDTQMADRDTRRGTFYFGSLDGRRVALCKTHDVRLPESDTGHHEVDFLQTGSWWWWTNRIVEGARPPEATFRVRGKRLP